MSKTQQRLSAEDWLAAALAALLHDGPDAVAVQPLARRLGATKGSFYWHFASRDDLMRATLSRWEVVATDDVIAALEATPQPAADKAKKLFAQVTASGEHYPGQLSLLAATDHPDVAAAVERATQRRIDYVAQLLRECGLTPAVAQRRATLAYAMYLGHAHLVRTTPAVLPSTPRARRALVDEMAAVMLG
jgi:AcrR family transcriptional regulator